MFKNSFEASIFGEDDDIFIKRAQMHIITVRFEWVQLLRCTYTGLTCGDSSNSSSYSGGLLRLSDHGKCRIRLLSISEK